MPGAEKHYAGRWICQSTYGKCDGIFHVYGEARSCPLSEGCAACHSKIGYLEWVWPQNNFGRLCIQSSPNWSLEHVARINKAKAAFCKDEVNAYYREYAAKHREQINERHREVYDPPLQKILGRNYIALNRKAPPAPPCGGDHRNCPYDGDCKYPDWDEKRYQKQAAKRRCNKKYAEKRKERIKSDPEYAAKERAKAKAYSKLYRDRKRSIMGVKRKVEGVSNNGQ